MKKLLTNLKENCAEISEENPWQKSLFSLVGFQQESVSLSIEIGMRLIMKIFVFAEKLSAFARI